MIRFARRALFLMIPALAACAPKPAEPAAVSAPPAAVIPVTTYVCEDGRVVRALYPDSRTVQLSLEGNTFRLAQAVSGSGARYTGEGLQWWSKGDEGMLATLKPGEDIAASPGMRCVPPARAPVEPAAPGTPGGLPDDRAPLDERPAQAGGAQAAATVVETYYALLESGRTAEAAKLRRDGAEVDLMPLATLSAQVGRPGRVEGAAGSLYVEVPVSLYGRYATGERYLKGGKVQLRRVNDVPGSTAEQRSWRISGFEPDLDLGPDPVSASPPTR